MSLRITENSRPHWVLVVAFFFLLTIIETWPIVLHADDEILGWAPDSYQVMWNLWWFKERLLGLDNPFRTSDLWYPQGTDLYMHTLTPVNGLFTLPFQLITGNVLLSWNIVMFGFFTASGVGAYALSYHVSRNPWASLLGGIIFAFAPFVMVHVHGHLNIATTWPIPFFVLFVLSYMDSGRPLWAALAGVFLAIMTWNWLEFAIDSSLFLLLFAGFWGLAYWRTKDRDQLQRLAQGAVICGAVWLTLSLPILIPSLYEVEVDHIQMSGGLSAPAEFNSADLKAYFTRSDMWGESERPAHAAPDRPTINSVEGTVFLGFLPLTLSVITIVASWRTERRNTALFWGGVFVFFVVMALGPYLYIDGRKTVDIFGWQFNGLSLPFRLFKEIPLIGLRRVPARMIVYGYLALAVLAPLGLAYCAEWSRRLSPALPGLVIAAVLVGVLAEYWNPPVGTASYTLPAIYEEIGEEDGDFTLLELPIGRITGVQQRGDILGGGMTNYSQITHGKRSIGGYFSRGQERDVIWLREQPGIGYLSCPVCPEFLRPEDEDGPAVHDYFTELRIKYVIVNLMSFEGEPTSYVTEGRLESVRAYLEETVGLDLIAEEETWLAYRNLDVP